MTVTRIITVDTLADVADAIALRAKDFSEQAESYERANDKNPGSIPLKLIAEARSILHGMEQAESIVRDCVFRDEGNGKAPTTHIGQLQAELKYLDAYAIVDWNSDKSIGFALDDRREKLIEWIAAETAAAQA